MQRLVLIFCLLPLIPAAFAAEGKWTPQQLSELGTARLKAMGLSLPASRLWDEKKGTGLLAATVWVDGCSGAFISSTGLFLTNHHCLFSILQEHATPVRNLINDGFLATAQEAELPGKAVQVRVPKSFRDVTAEVNASVPEGADDLARQRAIEAKQKALVAECEKPAATRCQVAVFDGGVRYVLVQTHELVNVKLVYAPPRAIGELGGEIDNWTWPRHSGDFAMGRAYSADGKPYLSEHFLPLAKQGVKPNDFVMVMGYPARTFRTFLAEEMAHRRDLVFPWRDQVFSERIRDFEAATRDNPAGRIAVADDVKTLANRRKNAQGQLAGFKRGRIVERVMDEEAAVISWAAQSPDQRDAVGAREALNGLTRTLSLTLERDLLLGTLFAAAPQPGSKALLFAAWVARAANQRQKPDLERDPEFMDRNLPRLRERLEREQKSYFPPADKRLFLSFVKRALALPKSQRLASIDRYFTEINEGRIEYLYSRSKVFELSERLAMFDGTLEQLRARKDPLIELGLALDQEIEALRERDDRLTGAYARLRPLWRKAVQAHAGKPIAPDANGTLRVSFAKVKGYVPRDGVLYTPQTTMAGLLAKHTGADPFDVPERIRTSGASVLDLPLCFLADADTTGGNSGSPTVNARGELVGVNFDRVWENVANDFGYNAETGRNVNADVRYLLWMLKLDKADLLLRELKH